MSRNEFKSLLVALTSLVLVAGILPTPAQASSDLGPEREHPAGPPGQQKARLHGVQVTADTAAVYSGRAFGAQVKVVLPVPSTRLYADTGVLATAGGSASASLAAIADAVFTSGPVGCSAQGGGTAAVSASTMERLSAFAGTAAALSCSSVRADARAACQGAIGSCTFSGLVFAGVSVVVTGAANQTVSIPGVATLVINEHVNASGSITVNALHLTLASGDELTVCSAHSDIACSTPTRSETWGAVKQIYR